MVRIFDVDDLAGQGHVTGDGALADLHGRFAEWNTYSVVLCQAEANLFLEEVSLGFRGLVVKPYSLLVTLEWSSFHQVNGSGVAPGKFPRLGQDGFHQFARIMLGGK